MIGNDVVPLGWIYWVSILLTNLVAPTIQNSLSDVIKVDGVTIRQVELSANQNYVNLVMGEKQDHVFLFFYNYLFNAHKSDFATFYSNDFGDTFEPIVLSNEEKKVNLDFIKILHNDVFMAGTFHDKKLFLSKMGSKELVFQPFPFDSAIVEAENCKNHPDLFALYALDKNSKTKLVITNNRFSTHTTHPLTVNNIKCIDYQITDDHKIVEKPSFVVFAKSIVSFIVPIKWLTQQCQLDSGNNILYSVMPNLTLVAILKYEDYQIYDENNYFVTIKDGKGHRNLIYSENGIRYKECTFPKRVDAKQFNVAHINEHNEIYVLVTNSKNATTLYAANKHDLKFVKILGDLLEDVGRSCSSVSANKGTPGTMMATLKKPKQMSVGAPYYQNIISFNGGTHWMPVMLLDEDLHASFPKCLQMKCALRLDLNCRHHTTDKLTHAPWIVSAWGTIVDEKGDVVMDETGLVQYEGTFFSHNGGHTWKTYFKTKAHISVLNHGSLLVAITHKTKEISISLDEGLSWKSVPFSQVEHHVSDLFVLENDDEIKLISLSKVDKKPTFIMSIFYFIDLLKTTCTEEDFEDFVYHVMSEAACYRGKVRVFKRKKLTSKCLIDSTELFKVSEQKCACSVDDYMCDFGHMKLEDGQCVPDPDDDYKKLECNLENAGKIIPSGYKILDSDQCKHDYGGTSDETIHADVCYFTGDTRFLALSGNTSMTIYLELPKTGFDPSKHLTLKFNKKVSQLQYDFQARCLYGLSNFKVVKYCWSYDQKFETAKFVEVSSVLVGIVSIQFDFATRNLYALNKDHELKLYQVDKSIHKTISSMDKQIKDFKLYPITGLIFYRVKNQTNIYAMNSNGSDSSSFKTIIGPVDIYDVDLLNHFIMTISVKDTGPKFYDMTGKPVKSPADWKIPDDIVSAAIGDGFIFYTTEKHLLISDRNKKETKIPFKTEGDFELSYHPNEISYHQHCQFAHCEQICFNHEKEGSCGCKDGYHFQTNKTEVNYNKCVKYYGVCKKDEFSCATVDKCIPLSKKCNYVDDCGDYSDEQHCDYDCKPTEFHCEKDHKCIPENKVCDDIKDCSDGSDEVSCTEHSGCDKKTEFNCGDGKCISLSLKCNGNNDCDNGVDEENCPHNCTADQFRCGDGQCINKLLRCNGYNDCLDMSDEEKCENHVCHAYCDQHLCLQKSDICNGVRECEDGFDEKYCDGTTHGSHKGKKLALSIIFILLIVGAVGFMFYKFSLCGKMLKKIQKQRSFEPIPTSNRYYDRAENSGLLSNDSNGSEDEDFFH